MPRRDRVRWLSLGPDPGILAPFRGDRRSFARLVWGSPFYRPVSLGLANPWTEWRLFTLRLPWVLLPFVSLRIGKLLFYLGAKCYQPGPDHTYLRPGDLGKTTITLSARLGWEPLS